MLTGNVENSQRALGLGICIVAISKLNVLGICQLHSRNTPNVASLLLYSHGGENELLCVIRLRYRNPSKKSIAECYLVE